MTTLKASKENNAIVKSLKKIAETKWVGNTIHDNLEKCLVGINLEVGKNSGWYNPSAIKIDGLKGFYMVNEDGSLCFDYRVIKESDKNFRIETMTTSAYNEFENLYCSFIED